jgi:hypothetical protein
MEQKTPEQTPSEPVPTLQPEPQKPYKKFLIIETGVLVALLVVAAAVFAIWHFHHSSPQPNTQANTTATTSKQATTASQLPGLQLDPSKNYGNKYADGILPVGDGKYVTDSPKQGYVYACTNYAHNLATDNGGAMVRGPWFTDNNTAYNTNEKLHVQGSVMWQADFTNTLSGSTRTIVTNDLPTHPTGIFPIMSSDPAYHYDHNPNTITGQALTFNLSSQPTYGTVPTCIGGTVGIMLTGVELFSGFDAGGRDAGAWEVQDSCNGHPQSQGLYHYHTLSSCIKDTSVHTVLGFALDGFPITGPKVGTNDILTSADLDECHGITSEITLDGKTVTSYHYVMTEDFPYSVSCYRGTPIQPPGMPSSPPQHP